MFRIGKTMDRKERVATIAVTIAVMIVSTLIILNSHANVVSQRGNLGQYCAAGRMSESEMARTRRIDQTAIELRMTADQKTQFQAAQDEFRPVLDRLREDRSLTQVQIIAQMRRVHKVHEARIRAILFPEQQIIYDRMHAKTHVK